MRDGLFSFLQRKPMPHILRPNVELSALIAATGLTPEDISRQTGIPKTRIHAATLGRDNLSIDNLAACKAVLTDALRSQATTTTTTDGRAR